MIAPPDMPYQQRIFNILAARGFLLDQHDGAIFLSGNSLTDKENRENDRNFLSHLLNLYNIGNLENDKLYIGDEVDKGTLAEMFLRHSGCEGYGLSYDSWDQFKNRVQGVKIPVVILDSFIAQ
ncbi:MAG: hypothetical protein PHO01_02885 [Desulfotomaculaceae bacterium]|nr:hypothetical protein [Desulfotomaculaceae bacterium]